MLLGYRGQKLIFKFGFNYGSSYYDPLLANPSKDIYVSISRGLNGYGSIIQNAVSLINSSYKISAISAGTPDGNGNIYPVVTFNINHTLSIGDSVSLYGVGGNYDGDYVVNAVNSSTQVVLKAFKVVAVSLSQFNPSLNIGRVTPKTSSYITRISESEYNFIYQIPETLFPGNYTVVIKTQYGSIDQTLEINFQISENRYTKTASVIATKVEDGIATLYTDEVHQINSGDYISVENVGLSFDGNHYISTIPTSKQISYPLSIPNQAATNLDSKGLVKLLDLTGMSPVLSGPNQPTKISYRPMYDNLQPFSTNSILLVGHADNVQLNDVIKITSVQEAINILGADGKSPLLRGVLEAYNSGARDIYVCAAAPMSEYIDHTENRNVNLGFLGMSFYEKYYQRLATTYSVVKYYEFIDMIVPLEASIMNTGSVNFITQLATYLSDFHNQTGFVQIGIIGSRSNGIKDSDISILESNSLFRNKFTVKDSNNEIISDIGRFLIPVYGEINFSHTSFPTSYVGTAAAAYAGSLSTTPVYNAMIRKRLPASYSLYGSNLSTESLLKLDNLGINTVYRSRRANRGNPYEIYVSNDYTMAAKNSVFSKLAQVRLAAMVINEVKSIGYDSIGKFAYDSVTAKIRGMLDLLVASKVIRDYSLDAYADRYIKGSMIFQLTLVSTLNLKNIKFSVSAGPGA